MSCGQVFSAPDDAEENMDEPHVEISAELEERGRAAIKRPIQRDTLELGIRSHVDQRYGLLITNKGNAGRTSIEGIDDDWCSHGIGPSGLPAHSGTIFPLASFHMGTEQPWTPILVLSTPEALWPSSILSRGPPNQLAVTGSENEPITRSSPSMTGFQVMIIKRNAAPPR